MDEPQLGARTPGATDQATSTEDVHLHADAASTIAQVKQDHEHHQEQQTTTHPTPSNSPSTLDVQLEGLPPPIEIPSHMAEFLSEYEAQLDDMDQFVEKCEEFQDEDYQGVLEAIERETEQLQEVCKAVDQLEAVVKLVGAKAFKHSLNLAAAEKLFKERHPSKAEQMLSAFSGIFQHPTDESEQPNPRDLVAALGSGEQDEQVSAFFESKAGLGFKALAAEQADT